MYIYDKAKRLYWAVMVNITSNLVEQAIYMTDRRQKNVRYNLLKSCFLSFIQYDKQNTKFLTKALTDRI